MFVSRFFTEPVNFKDEYGKWQPIDNNLERTSGGHVNKASSYRLKLPDNAGEPVRVSEGSAWVEYQLEGAAAPAAVSENKGEYRRAAPGVDLGYSADGDSVKETLTLASPDVQRSFRFKLTASAGLTAVKRGNGRIDVVDGDTVKFSFAPPLMWDSSKKLRMSRKISVDLKRVAGGYVIELAPDRKWLESKRREWPVVLDPTITFPGPERDCHIRGGFNSANGSTSYCGAPMLGVGESVEHWEEGGIDDYRALLKFNLGSVIPADAQVHQAKLGVYSDGGGPAPVHLYDLRHAWTDTASWDSPDGVNLWDGGSLDMTGHTINESAGATGWSHWYPTELLSVGQRAGQTTG